MSLRWVFLHMIEEYARHDSATRTFSANGSTAPPGSETERAARPDLGPAPEIGFFQARR